MMKDSETSKDFDARRRELLVAGLTAPLWLPALSRSATAAVQQTQGEGKPERKLRLTLAYENNEERGDLTTKWGFSCIVEGLEKTILFDTGGEGDVLVRNLEILGFDRRKIDAIVLSHEHWDHVGGLEAALAGRKGVPVYVPKGLPDELKKSIEALGVEMIEAQDSVVVDEHARTTGTLGQGAIVEHALCVQTKDGWSLITGCAHPGVDELAALAKEVTGGPIQLAVGGFHMGRHGAAAIDAVIDRFEELDVKVAAPGHCTGDPARARFEERLADRCVLPGVGRVFTLGR
jgi:7,8-dihydropterin-6-yl-methyl-4-(beta-D-ribofuranosyl)aminobenzene 5'-phosphate synthase